MIVWLNGTHGVGTTTTGALVLPMTVLVEASWRAISDGLARYDVPIRHVVLHTKPETLRARIDGDDTTTTPAPEVARTIAERVRR